MTDKVRTEDQGAIRILRINRPEQRNAVDGETAVGLGQAIEAFADDDRARVLVVTGEGELSFCAGADLSSGVSGWRNAGRPSSSAQVSRSMTIGLTTVSADVRVASLNRGIPGALPGGD